MTIKQLFPTQRPALDLNFARQKRLDPRVTFTRASIGTYVGSDGLIKTAASGEARFDHDPATGESLGLLIEESRTNAFSNSTFSSNNKQGTNIVETPNAFMAPDGTMTATRIQADNINYYNSQFPYSSAAGQYTVYSYWVYVNYAFRIRTRLSGYGVISTKDHIVEPGVWTRIFHRTPVVADATGLQLQPSIFRDSGSIDVYVWGFQLENGPFLTSYIPTSGSTVTRSADVASISGTNFTSWYNQNGGTIFTSYSGVYHSPWTLGSSQSPRLILGWFDNEVQIYDGTSDTRVVFPGDYPTTTSTTKEAVGLDSQNLSAARDGSVNTKTHSSVITGLYSYARLEIGLTSNTSRRLNGHISRLTYYPVRLPDATLQALTL